MRYVLAVFVSAVIASNALCEDATFKMTNWSLSAGLGIMDGHTTYQIGGHYEVPEGGGEVRFPLSELEFPLDAFYGSLGATIDLIERFEIAAGFKKNISKDTGKMKDRDWGIAYGQIDWWTDPDSLDTYSVSDAEIDALIMDISARFYFDPWRYRKLNVLFFFGGKYMYQYFDFTASDLEKWSPSLSDYYGFDVGRENIPGKVLTYELWKNIPAFIAGAKLFTGPNFTLDVMLGYSPAVTIEDEDHHILRSLVTKSECDGNAVLFSLNGDIEFFTRWSLLMKYDYSSIDAEGEEKQYVRGEYVATIEQKNFSDLRMYEMSLKYRF